MNDPRSAIVLLPGSRFKAQHALTDTVTSLRKSESRRLCAFLGCCAKRRSRGIEASKRQLSIMNTLMFKGELMRKNYLRFLIALIGVAGLGVAAKGQAVDQIVVNIPYEFVVDGKTLPPGTYRVNRLSDIHPEVLILSSFDGRAGLMVRSTEVESTRADKPEVSFEQIDGQHFLSKIETADHVFTIPVSRSEILEAAAKSARGTSASGK